MKKLFTIALMLVSFGTMAQTKVTRDAQGNYIVAKRDSTGTNKATGHTITDKEGISHPVYISARGKLYYNRTAKSGNVYKCYIKEI